MSALLTGLPLAHALCEQGLAPDSAWLHTTSEGEHWYTYEHPDRQNWRPWDSLDAVAHLMERFWITFRFNYPRGHWYVYVLSHFRKRGVEYEPATPFAELPAAVARLALLLHAAEQKEQNR